MPFRERIALLNQMLKSLKDTTHSKDDIELIMAVDLDDEVLNNYGKERIIEENKWLKIRFYETQRSEHFINDYWNPIARLAEGRWVMAINDDSVFLTGAWDKKINTAMSKRATESGDDIIYGKVDDCCNLGERNSKDCYFSCWCLVGREMIDALGFFYDPHIWVWGPDQVCGLIFLALRNMGEDRIIDIYDVVIDHDSFHGSKREKDKFFYEQEKIDKAHWYQTTREQEMAYAIKLKQYIDNKRSK
jgi:hypothetical protein